MTSLNPPEDDRQGQPDEDTEAILSRRRFLISSTLAGAGLGGAMSGCGPYSRPCLTLPRKPPPPQPPGPKPCLKVPAPPEPEPPKPEPKVCLKVPAPAEPEPPKPEPKVCLKVPAPS